MIDDKIYPSFALKGSLFLRTLIWFIHMGAIFCLYFISIGLWAKAALLFLALASLLVTMRGSSSVNGFCYTNNNEWFIKKSSGEVVPGSLSYPIFISNYFIIMVFNQEKMRIKVVLPIFRDSLPRDKFRELRVMLRAS